MSKPKRRSQKAITVGSFWKKTHVATGGATFRLMDKGGYVRVFRVGGRDNSIIWFENITPASRYYIEDYFADFVNSITFRSYFEPLTKEEEGLALLAFMDLRERGLVSHGETAVASWHGAVAGRIVSGGSK